MDSSPEWLDLWRRTADADAESSRRLIGDVCAGIELVTDNGPDDPDEVIALSIAGAQAAEATSAGLDQEWALYTPQQAAVVASALFAQIDAAGAALQKLSQYLHIMDARDDVDMPEFDGDDEPNLSNAEATLGAIGEETRAALSDTKGAVRVLAETPYVGTLPVDAHQTITAVAELLGDTAVLVSEHHIHDDAELRENYSQGYGCGCSIKLQDATGSEWEFQRGDSTWNLFRHADVGENGVLQTWTELRVTEPGAHPGHVVTLLNQEIASAGHHA